MRDGGLRALETLEGELDVGTFGAKATLLGRAIALGLPVPAGIAVSASSARSWSEGRSLDALREALRAIGAAELGDAEGWERGTLFVSLRTSSGDDRTLPTILDVGATGPALLALEARLGDRSAALDARLRFLRGLSRARGRARRSSVVVGRRVDDEAAVRAEIDALTSELGLEGASRDDELRAALSALASREVPLIVQAMRFGSSRRGPSGAGTASSRHPITGEARLFGEIAWDRQGEDLSLGQSDGVSLRRAAAGRRADESLEARAGATFLELERYARRAEEALSRVVDLELVVEAGALSILQLRETVLTPRAELRVLVDRVGEGALSREEALLRVDVESMAKLGRVEVADADRDDERVLARGLPASPGAASGALVIDVEEACLRAERGESVVLIRSDVSPEDAPAIRAAVAVATASGGLTSHAAVMSRALGRPCIVSASGLSVRSSEIVAASPRPGGQPIRLVPGELVTVDGTSGRLSRGARAMCFRVDDEAPMVLAGWASERSRERVVVEAMGEAPLDVALALGADGVAAGEPHWDGPGRALPEGPALAVEPLHVAAARVALAQRRLRSEGASAREPA